MKINNLIYKYSFVLAIFLLLFLSNNKTALADVVWSETGGMNSPRTAFTSNLLPNGKVLVAGGAFNNSTLNSSEIYDPNTGEWTPTGNLNTPRFHHASVTLADGRVLVVGGRNPLSGTVNPISSAEIYDPNTGEWTLVASMFAPRYDHTATLLQDGRVLVVGQTNVALGSSPGGRGEIYNPITNTWTLTSFLHSARWQHSATLLSNGNVLIAFGLSQRGQEDSSEVYNPNNNTWTEGFVNWGGGRFDHTSVLLDNGNVLVAGGIRQFQGYKNESLTYNPTNNTWSSAGNLVQARNLHNMVKLQDGSVIIVGGFNGNTLSSTELYDPLTNLWNYVGDLNFPRRSASALLINDRALIVGGGYFDITNSAELYPSSIQDLTPPEITASVSSGIITWTIEDPESGITSMDGCDTAPMNSLPLTCSATNGVNLSSSRTASLLNLFLHANGPQNNPTDLFLNIVSPTNSTFKYKDSAGVNYSGGNAWKEIGTWTAEANQINGELINFSSLSVWLGLKNSDDLGTNFDIKADIYENENLIISGETLCVSDLKRNANLAKEVSLNFPSIQNIETDNLQITISARIGTNPDGSKCGGHNNAVGIRLYFDSINRSSKLDSIILSTE